jgi:hypothetical protein
MKLYYIETTADSNGEHLAHLSECDKVPNFLSRRLLGHFNSFKEALVKANKTALIKIFDALANSRPIGD